jgi:hypothetical protein
LSWLGAFVDLHGLPSSFDAMDLVNLTQTKGPMILGVFWAFFAVSVIMVSARLYIRARWLRNIGLDDYIITVSMVGSTARPRQ